MSAAKGKKGYLASWQTGKGGKGGKSFEEEVAPEPEPAPAKTAEGAGESEETENDGELYYRGAKNLRSMFEQKKEDPKPKKKFVMDVERGPAKVYENDPVATVNPDVVRSSDPVPFIVDNEKGFIKNIANQILSSADKDRDAKPTSERRAIVVNRDANDGCVLESNPQATPPDVVRCDEPSCVVQVERGHIKNKINQIFSFKNDDEDETDKSDHTPAWIKELEAAKKPGAKSERPADDKPPVDDKAGKEQHQKSGARTQRTAPFPSKEVDKTAGVSKLNKDFPPKGAIDPKIVAASDKPGAKDAKIDQAATGKGNAAAPAQDSKVAIGAKQQFIFKDGKKVPLGSITETKAAAVAPATGKPEEKKENKLVGLKAKFPPSAAASLETSKTVPAGKSAAAPVRNVSIYK
jgi:hypothetical protein